MCPPAEINDPFQLQFLRACFHLRGNEARAQRKVLRGSLSGQRAERICTESSALFVYTCVRSSWRDDRGCIDVFATRPMAIGRGIREGGNMLFVSALRFGESARDRGSIVCDAFL